MFSAEMPLRVLLFPLWLLGQFRLLWNIEIMKRRLSVTSQKMKEPSDLLFELLQKVSRAMMWKSLISKSKLDLLSCKIYLNLNYSTCFKRVHLTVQPKSAPSFYHSMPKIRTTRHSIVKIAQSPFSLAYFPPQ